MLEAEEERKEIDSSKPVSEESKFPDDPTTQQYQCGSDSIHHFDLNLALTNKDTLVLIIWRIKSK